MANLLYPYKLPTIGDIELVRSIRSAVRFLGVDSLWIVGDEPPSLENCNHLKRKGPKVKWLNSIDRIIYACSQPDFPDEFLLFNDDFILTDFFPNGFPVLHWKPIGKWMEEHQPKNGWSPSYYKAHENTAKVTGTNFPSFELHCPMPMEKERVLFTAKKHKLPALKQFRTLYAFDHGIVGEYSDDRKAYMVEDLVPLSKSGKWLSLSGDMALTQQFKSITVIEPSRYEKN